MNLLKNLRACYSPVVRTESPSPENLPDLLTDGRTSQQSRLIGSKFQKWQPKLSVISEHESIPVPEKRTETKRQSVHWKAKAVIKSRVLGLKKSNFDNSRNYIRAMPASYASPYMF